MTPPVPQHHHPRLGLIAPTKPFEPAIHDPPFIPPWDRKLVNLSGWRRLPKELQDRIWTLACTLRPLRSYKAIDTSPLAIDLRTTRSIALVSRDCYRAAINLLYRRVRIQRPSELKALQTTLANRPSLGRLIQSLHVGPLEELPEHWWPLRSVDGSLRFATNLVGVDLDARRPSWCCPRHEFDMPCKSAEEPKYLAVSNALEVAYHALDVDITRPNENCAKEAIGADTYTVRLFEVQAACELFLLEMRRREDAQGVDKGDKVRYPQLAIMGSSQEPDFIDDDVFWVSRSQIRAHLARAGAKTDLFNHPLLFARCGVKWTAKETHEEQSESRHGGDDFSLGEGTVEDVADVFSLASSFRRLSGKDGPIDVCDELYFPTPSSATLGGNLASMRAVLSYTPCLKSLSLTGFLERAVCGTRAPPALNTLRSLTFGPPPPRWLESLRLDHPALASVERLRIAGCTLSEEEIDSIVGRNGSLSALNEVQWSFSLKYGDDGGLPLFDAVNMLLDSPKDVSAEAGGPSRKRVRHGHDALMQSLRGSARVAPLFIQARLHRHDVDALLSAAKDPTLRAAWQAGLLFRGHNRFQVIETRGGAEEKEFPRWSEIKAAQEMYAEGMEWWDAGSDM